MENKQELEKKHAELMNQEAIDRIKAEEEAKANTRSEVVWFEDDDEFVLRDGSRRNVPPLRLGHARKFMDLVKIVNIDSIILNFAPGKGNAETDLYDILAMAFQNYTDIVTKDENGKLIPNRDYLDENVDIRMTRKLIDTMLDLNSLKK